MKSTLSMLLILASAVYADAAVFKPAHCDTYDYINGAWELFSSYTFGYDEQGNVTREETKYPSQSSERTTSEYNADNMVVSENGYTLVNGEWVHTSADSYLYDAVVKDWQIERRHTDIRFNSGFKWHIKVVRNEVGNIVSAAYYWWDSDSEIDAIQYELTVEYAPDGKATKLIEEYFSESADVKLRTWTDLKWENPDGQIFTHVLGAKGNEYNWFLKGNNRLKNAIVSEDGVHKWSLSAQYSGKMGYLAKFTDSNAFIRSEQMEYTDEYDSYTQTVFSGGEWNAKTVQYDENGNETLRATAEDIDNLNPINAYFYENDYDPTTGCLVQTIVSQSEDGGMPGLLEKIVYSDFVDVSTSSVQEIENDARPAISINGMTISAVGNATLRVYRIDGTLVASSADGNVTVQSHGIYIVVIEGKAIKVKI